MENITSELQLCDSIVSFKRNLLVFVRDKPKSIFDIHNPIGVKHLFILRLGLSPLKYDKFRHNFNDAINDTCQCGFAPENVHHFFFECPLYHQLRIIFIDYVSHLLNPHIVVNIIDNVTLLLYGDRSLSDYVNKCLLLSTIKFIIDSKRFDS